MDFEYEVVNLETTTTSRVITKERMSVFFTKEGVVLSTTKDKSQARGSSSSAGCSFNSKLKRSNSTKI